MSTLYISLPGGRRVVCEVRVSDRRKTLGLVITEDKHLVARVPRGVSETQIEAVVARHSNWILRHLGSQDGDAGAGVDKHGHSDASHSPGDPSRDRRRGGQRERGANPPGEGQPAADKPGAGQHCRRAETPLPETFDLRAVDEHWAVTYIPTADQSRVMAQTIAPLRLGIYGAVTSAQACRIALRRWLTHRAKRELSVQLNTLAAKFGFRVNRVTIRCQHTRWGSCSGRNNINLNMNLLFLPKDLVRYVLIHELCHTIEHNHSTQFWVLVRQYEPGVDELRRQMKEAAKLVPEWAQPWLD